MKDIEFPTRRIYLNNLALGDGFSLKFDAFGGVFYVKFSFVFSDKAILLYSWVLTFSHMSRVNLRKLNHVRQQHQLLEARYAF